MLYDLPNYIHTNNGTTLAFLGDVIVVTIHYRVGVFGSLHTGNARIPGGIVPRTTSYTFLVWWSYREKRQRVCELTAFLYRCTSTSLSRCVTQSTLFPSATAFALFSQSTRTLQEQ